jgi:hypothetical protein
VRLPNKIRRRALLAAVVGGLVAVATAIAILISGNAPSAPVGADGGFAVGAGVGSPAGTGGGSPAGAVAGNAANVPAGAGSGTTAARMTSQAPPDLAGATPTHLVVPDVIASVPGGVTEADLAKIQKLNGVRAVLAIDGARITVNGASLTVLAAPAAALRPWTPPATASSTALWSAFGAGDLITTTQAAAKARLTPGGGYPVAAAVKAHITDGGTALLGVAGVDGVVNQAEGKKLGLVKNVAVLVNAPAVSVTTLTAQVQAALGSEATVVPLVSAEVPTSLPVDTSPPAGRPQNYLQLFQESAASYCPGLSWTVLAAIGQIESADGQNMGPSTSGALGPMQFLPSTWATWGINGFGDTGSPNIMNPFDAVPSAARMLCADGATSGAQGLRQAIFDYNHANWYVDEVLTLAAEYAREYG